MKCEDVDVGVIDRDGKLGWTAIVIVVTVIMPAIMYDQT